MNVIYVDELFFLNALTDYLLLLSCARLRGKTLRRGRFAAAAAVGGVYAVFAAIPPLSFLVSLAAKALVSLLMAWIAFSAPPELWRGWGCFLALSSAFAGAVYGISLLSGVEPRGVLSGASLKTLVLSFGLCYAAVRLFFGRFLRRRERCIVDAEIVLCGRTDKLAAFGFNGHCEICGDFGDCEGVIGQVEIFVVLRSDLTENCVYSVIGLFGRCVIAGIILCRCVSR